MEGDETVGVEEEANPQDVGTIDEPGKYFLYILVHILDFLWKNLHYNKGFDLAIHWFYVGQNSDLFVERYRVGRELAVNSGPEKFNWQIFDPVYPIPFIPYGVRQFPLYHTQ